MKSAKSPVIGKGGAKTVFAPKAKSSSKASNNPKKMKFSVAQFHAKKGNVMN